MNVIVGAIPSSRTWTGPSLHRQAPLRFLSGLDADGVGSDLVFDTFDDFDLIVARRKSEVANPASVKLCR